MSRRPAPLGSKQQPACRGMLRNGALLVALLPGVLLLALAGCGRGGDQAPDVSVELAIEPQPPQVGPATVTAGLVDAGGRPVSGAAVELEGNMSHAGMVPVLATAAEVAPGRYRAELDFTMGGDWFVVVRARLPDGRALERTVEVPGVEGE